VKAVTAESEGWALAYLADLLGGVGQHCCNEVVQIPSGCQVQEPLIV